MSLFFSNFHFFLVPPPSVRFSDNHFNSLPYKVTCEYRLSSIYYFEKSGAGRFPPLMPDSIDDFRQISANAVDGEVRKERKDVT